MRAHKYPYSNSQSSAKSNCSSVNQLREKRKPNLYNQVAQYRTYTQTPDLKKHEQQIKNFIQNYQHKVLFIFGPSGCGKHMLVNNLLNQHKILYQYRAQQLFYKRCQNQFENFNFNQNQTENMKVKSLQELIIESISREYASKVQIYQDFPIPNLQMYEKQMENIKKFRIKLFNQIKNSQCKIIFILNSQIYNKYYILPKQCPSQVSQLTLKPYLASQIKSILKKFVQEHPIFDWIIKSKDILDQIIQISNGDMRKFLLNVYKNTIIDQNTSKYLSKQQKVQHKFKLKNQQRFPLFHMLGKYLYAKRYDTMLKKDRVFTRKQLQQSDPPFYFNPVDLFLRSNVPLSTFTELLFQNFLTKVGDIRDARQILQLFCQLDHRFPFYISSKRINGLPQQSQRIYIFLLTWGIIVKNKSSSQVEKKFSNFKKSELKYVLQQLQNKKSMLRQYFAFRSVEGLVKFGFMLRNSRCGRQYLIGEIVRKRVRQFGLLKEQQVRTLGDDQEQEIISKQYQNSDNSFIRIYNSKRKAKQSQMLILKQMQAENDSSSDIEN